VAGKGNWDPEGGFGKGYYDWNPEHGITSSPVVPAVELNLSNTKLMDYLFLRFFLNRCHDFHIGF